MRRPFAAAFVLLVSLTTVATAVPTGIAAAAENVGPVNNLPSAQSVDQDANLIFSAGNGNAISVADNDAGSNPVQVTLTATNGTFTLAGTTGLAFSVGDGVNDSTMTFTGTLADINAALNGSFFTPTSGYNGAASLQIASDDQGWTGTGGAQSDTDTVSITVLPLNPSVTSVAAPVANGTYGIGANIDINVVFDMAVAVNTAGGSPTLALAVGGASAFAQYMSGSGTSMLTFRYTVQALHHSADLDYVSSAALALNGATIQSGSFDDAILTLPAPGGVNSIAGQKAIVIDGLRPTASVLVAPDQLAAGDTATVTVEFSERVTGFTVDDVAISGGALTSFASADGGVTWTATFTPEAGVTAPANTAVLSMIGVADTADNAGTGTVDSNEFAIDTAAPTATVIVSPAAVGPSETALVTVTFSEPIGGLDAGDFDVTGGAVGDVAPAAAAGLRLLAITPPTGPTALVWTATFTPTPDASVEGSVVLDLSGVTDLFGNPGATMAVSNAIAVETVPSTTSTTSTTTTSTTSTTSTTIPLTTTTTSTTSTTVAGTTTVVTTTTPAVPLAPILPGTGGSSSAATVALLLVLAGVAVTLVARRRTSATPR